MSGTQFPGWTAGEEITADLLNDMTPIVAFKTAATARTSTTTSTSDPDLLIDLSVSGTYLFEGFINYTGGTLGSSDLKLAVNYTGSQTNGVWGGQGITTASATALQSMASVIGTSTIAWGTAGATFQVLTLNGYFQVTSPGQFQIQWAQNTSNATATNLRAGCWIKLTQVS